MKKTFFLLSICMLGLTGAALAGNNEGINPGKKITENFRTDFPGATTISWSENSNEILVAHFVQNSKAQDAYYKSDGEFLGQGWFVDFNEVAPIIKTGILSRQTVKEVRSVYVFLPAEGFPVYYATLETASKTLIKEVNSYGDSFIVSRKAKTVFLKL
jgi:hypothetical protein